MRALVPYFQTARRLVQTGGPYLLLELLLPGGTLFALLLFLYRRKGSKLAAFVHRIAPARVLRNLSEQIMLPLDVYAWATNADTRCRAADDGLDAFGFSTGCVPAAAACRPVRRARRGFARSEVIAVH